MYIVIIKYCILHSSNGYKYKSTCQYEFKHVSLYMCLSLLYDGRVTTRVCLDIYTYMYAYICVNMYI